MNKFFIVLRHTYLKHIKSRAFVISTIITMILISLMMNVGTMVDKSGNKTKKVAVVAADDKLYNLFKEQVKHSKQKIELTKTSTEDSAKQELEKGTNAYLLLDSNKESYIKATYKAKELVDQELMMNLENILGEVKTKSAIAALNLKKEQVEPLLKPFKMEKSAVDKKAKNEKQLAQSTIVVVGALFLIYATVVFYGMAIATEVAGEKSSRVMEVLVSSAPTSGQMFGKILGLALVGITQYLFFFISSFLAFKTRSEKSSVTLDQVPPSTFVYAIIFFLLGYFLYATLLATIGSIVNRIEDVHQMTSPVNVLVIIGFVLSIIALTDPTSKVIVTASFFPFFTPMLMFLRVSLVIIPFWQVIVSIIVMIVSIILFGMLGAKIYRGGVLIYGKSSLINILKAIKITKENK